MILPLGQPLRQGVFCLATAVLVVLSTPAAELVQPGSSLEEPKVAPASNEGELAMKRFVLQPGFKVELFAAEPLLANPVAFHIDDRGRFFIAETFRHSAGVTDIRGHMNWLDEDLAARTVEDRLAMLKRHEGSNFHKYSRRSDRVKLLWDSDGDGKADQSSVFADGFNHPLSGIGSGVLAYDGDVYYANLPDLWHLVDQNDDGRADERKSLLYGFGVRVGFIGHDLHGLTFGPDGKLYFTIGDRGASVIVGDRRIGDPDSGAVYRCNPDGSGLEIFCFGLRNPQEIAFDNFGNLFTVDNNSDGGDRARLLYLVEGADYGWRIGYQFIDRPNPRGPWNAEKLWHPQWEGQAAYLIPAIANITDGPSGLAYYPGTGLPDKYQGNFFIVDFHGGRGSGIMNFSVKPNGAGFSLDKTERFIWEALPTDVDFGPDGALYFTDWVQGWNITGKGRIYKVSHPDLANDSLVDQTRGLLLTSMHGRSGNQLGELLGHPNARVRQRAQFELAKRGLSSAAIFSAAMGDHSFPLKRVHAIWGLGQLATKASAAEKDTLLAPVRQSLLDPHPEVAAQAAKVLGDHKATFATDDLIKAMATAQPSLRLHAAIALGKMKSAHAVPQLFALLRKNANHDPYLRHAASWALAWSAQPQTLITAASSDSPAERMGALLALRRLERSEIAVFLADPEPAIVLEAARAINDLPINGAMSELAALAQTHTQPSPDLARRIVNANYRCGTKETARALAAVAQNQSWPEVARTEAVRNLLNWELPSGKDNITSLWRPPVGARDPQDAISAIKPVLASLLQSTSDPIRLAAIQAVSRFNLSDASDQLVTLLRNESLSSATRVQALRALATLQHPGLTELLQFAVTSSIEDLRKAALQIQSQSKPAGALAQIAQTLTQGTVGEKQSALAALGTLNHPAAEKLLLDQIDALIEGNVSPELHLDILDAAAKSPSEVIRLKLAAYHASLPKEDLAPFRPVLFGGNAAEGRKIFIERAEAACLRCHKAPGTEGGEVGPDLSHIGSQQSREYLLEAIIFPNKHIAKGYESLIVELKDGTAYAGIVHSENEKELVLNSPEDGIVNINKAEIDKTTKGLSSMPEGLDNVLSKRDLRDLVEYLSTLK